MISRREVEHIARLCRIELSESEKTRFEKELSAILEFVAKLDEVDTTEVEPLTPLETKFLTGLTGGTDLINVLREDEVIADKPMAVSHQKLVEAAPANREGYVEVKAVFEERAG